MGNAEVRELETFSTEFWDVIKIEDPQKQREEFDKLVYVLGDLLNRFENRKGRYTDYSEKKYTRRNWQWWQIIASLSKIEECLLKMSRYDTSNFSFTKRIIKLTREMREE